MWERTLGMNIWDGLIIFPHTSGAGTKSGANCFGLKTGALTCWYKTHTRLLANSHVDITFRMHFLSRSFYFWRIRQNNYTVSHKKGAIFIFYNNLCTYWTISITPSRLHSYRWNWIKFATSPQICCHTTLQNLNVQLFKSNQSLLPKLYSDSNI